MQSLASGRRGVKEEEEKKRRPDDDEAAAAAAADEEEERRERETEDEEEDVEFFVDERYARYATVADDHGKRYGERSSFFKRASQWRLRERMRTVSVALVCCLNIGVDPPDVVKPDPCARLEAWIDPLAVPPQRALDTIGAALQRQFERWQPRARYRQALDPTIDGIKRLCTSLRRVARDERVLFHYNGHGVPKPSENGEIWVFNHNYTQYMPLSIYDLQTWMQSPSIYVFDCSAAGLIIDAFHHFLHQRDHETHGSATPDDDSPAPSPLPPHALHPHTNSDNILLAACAADQVLPVNPEFPADIFTACLTTPIKIALRWFSTRSVLGNVTHEMIDQIPGRTSDRKTPLGELNWIFTAITDTIAWNVLPLELFQKLFRQDLLVASLFRNFLLADRVLRSVNCTPISWPRIPATHKHPMWNAWDLAADFCLSQLDAYLKDKEVNRFQHSSFFEDQLTAFDVWLEFGTEDSPPPMQLPIVLQVLLSQVHRHRALKLLARFVDKGRWAVKQALSVGIFPYVLKLLQSPAVDLREVLVFIWAKILAYDPSCQAELVRDKYQQYFVNHLASQNASSWQRVMAAFIVSAIARHHRQGQDAVLRSQAMPVFVAGLASPDPQLRCWMCLCIAVVWEKFEEAKWNALAQGVPEHLSALLKDPIPDVRAAAVYALGTFMGGSPDQKRATTELLVGRRIAKLRNDGSVTVRHEAVIAMAELVTAQRERFANISKAWMSEGDVGSFTSPVALAGPGRHRHHSHHSHRSGRHSAGGGGSSRRSQHSHVSTGTSAASRGGHSMYSDRSVSPVGSPKFTPSSVSALDTPPDSPRSGDDGSDSAMDESNTGDGMGGGGQSVGGSGGSSIESGSHLESEFDLRSEVWRAVLTMCHDPFPAVAAAALALKRHITSLRFASGLGAIPDTEDTPSSTNSSAGVAAGPGSGAAGAGAAAGAVDTLLNNSGSGSGGHKSSLSRSSRGRSGLKAMDEGDEKHDFDDPRSHDSTWKVPISTIYEVCAAQFNKPQLGVNRSDDSVEMVENREWRRKRNREIDRQSKGMQTGPFDQIAVFHTGFDQISTVLFHPYENMLVAADTKDKVGVWDYKELEQINRFSNGNARGSQISCVELPNDKHVSLLLAGSDDGVVRVWKDPHVRDEQKLVSAWVAAKDTRGKFTMSWQQTRGVVVAAGATKYIRIWDVELEAIVSTIPSGGECITSVTSSYNGNLVAAGFTDGAVRLFDIRDNSRNPLKVMKKHKGRVVKVHLQRGGLQEGKLVSADLKGEVYLTDMMMSRDLSKITAHQTRPLNCFAVHDQASLMASGSHKQFIKVFDVDGNTLNVIKYHEGFLGQRIGRVSCLNFHKNRMLLCAGALDAFVSVHAGDVGNRRLNQLGDL